MSIKHPPIIDGMAQHMPISQQNVDGCEGALIAAAGCDDGKIAVVYNHGENPPKITVSDGTGRIQTVFADGVAVAVVAQSWGPGITANDVLLVERFVHQTR